MAKDYTKLITSEHNQRPKFKSMVEAVAGAWGAVYDATLAIPQSFDLDVAEGVQLDAVGLWVGQSRLIPDVLLIEFFGFDDNPAALPFGEEGNVSIGGGFWDETEPYTGSSILSDPEYRLLIRAKIAKNHAKGMTADIVNAASFLFQAPVYVHDYGDMSISVAIGRELTVVERAIILNLDILPRPAGVRIAWYGMFDADGYLGFEGCPGAVPFAEEGYVGPLGHLMEEFS